MITIIIYYLFTGIIYAAWTYDSINRRWVNIVCVAWGLTNGWWATPIIIGRVLKKML